jgi:hypothetical protein
MANVGDKIMKVEIQKAFLECKQKRRLYISLQAAIPQYPR